jgi:asparagine synthase (glutamine-hydrolysing)
VIGLLYMPQAEMAKRTAAHCGAKSHQLDVDEAALAEAFASTVWHAEAPILDLNAVAKFLFSKYVSDSGYKVLLTGEGADEHFAGYYFFRADFLRCADLAVEPALQWPEASR